MSEKTKIIQAFKHLDFDALEYLLDDKKSYMDVSKELFLSRLKRELGSYKNLKKYEKVIEGVCNFCNKGCKAYKFIVDDFPSLNLFFEEENNEVTDIYLCNSLSVSIPYDTKKTIYFSFYEDEKENFTPTLEYFINLQKVNKALEDFNDITSIGFVYIEDFVYWYNKHKKLTDELNLNNPFVKPKYKVFERLKKLNDKVSQVVHNFKENYSAIEALNEYQTLDKNDERKVISWLLKHKDQYFYSLEKTSNWKKTGFIILGTKRTIIVDCIQCIESFLFDELYLKIEYQIMEKYKPTKEHYNQYNGSIPYDLEILLKLHKKHLDLL